MNASNTPLPTCIDGISGADNIAQMWRDHYSDIFNSVNQSIDVVYHVHVSTDSVFCLGRFCRARRPAPFW